MKESLKYCTRRYRTLKRITANLNGEYRLSLSTGEVYRMLQCLKMERSIVYDWLYKSWFDPKVPAVNPAEP